VVALTRKTRWEEKKRVFKVGIDIQRGKPCGRGRNGSSTYKSKIALSEGGGAGVRAEWSRGKKIKSLIGRKKEKGARPKRKRRWAGF